MAIHGITHACGHAEEHEICGSIKDRESRAEWLSTTDCTDCWKKKKQQTRQEQSLAAQEKARKAGLPPLRGTPKQIEWGETIRLERLRYAEQVLREGETNQFIDDEKIGQCLAYLARREEAKWWIERREAGLVCMVAELPDAVEALAGFSEVVTHALREAMDAAAQERIHEEVRDAVEAVFGRVVAVKVGRWGDGKRVYIGPFGEGLEYIEKTDTLTDRGGLKYDKTAARAFCRELCGSFQMFRLRT